MIHFKYVALLICLSWLIFILSKIIFKKFFADGKWENLFVFFVGFSTIAYLLNDSLIALLALELEGTVEYWFYPYDILAQSSLFFYPLLLFFIAYLIHFFIRIIRYRR
jgi:hypothetical protein